MELSAYAANQATLARYGLPTGQVLWNNRLGCLAPFSAPRIMKNQSAEVELPVQSKRPFGVYAIAALLLLGVAAGVLEILRVQIELFGFWQTADEVLREYSGLTELAAYLFIDPKLVIIANTLVIVFLLLLISGLWRMKRWAWLLVMIFTGANLTLTLIRYFNDNPDYLSMLIHVAVTFYLNDRDVQRAFARPNAAKRSEPA
jgi:hypothetical protein